MFSHEKLKVYSKSLEFHVLIVRLIKAIPAGNSDVINQLRRAAMSISLNIAEGAGKTGTNDKKRFYSIARGSALECAAIFDLLKIWELCDETLLVQANELLLEITAMLSSMAFSLTK